MSRRNKFFAFLVAAMLMVSAAACGGESDRSKARSQLIDNGASDEEADCILDAAEEAGLGYDDTSLSDVPEDVRDEFIALISDC